MEAQQTEALQQLQQQVLKELEEKIQGTSRQKAPSQTTTGNKDDSEWVKRAKKYPHHSKGQDESPPKKYSYIARKEQKPRPQTVNTNGGLTWSR